MYLFNTFLTLPGLLPPAFLNTRAQPFQEPTQEASEDTSFDTIEVFNHVIQTVLNINKAEAASFHSWMK